jgi:serpin B
MSEGRAVELGMAGNAFGMDLYDRLRKSPGNLVISPASIELALLMTWGGAREQTSAEMAKVLHLESLGPDAHAAAGVMLDVWNDPARDAYELAVVNRIFVEKTAPVEKGFEDLTKAHYGAGYETLNFIGDPDGSRQHINTYVAKQTKDRIEDLLPERSIDDLTRVVLTNAVYFLGKWQHRFDEDATRDAPFFVDGKTEVAVPTMNQGETFAVSGAEGVAVLQMPYVAEELAMVVILPEAKDGLAAIEKRMIGGEYRQWIDGLSPKKIEVAIPRFRIEMPKSLVLKDTLIEMGMPIAFTDDADFRDMADPPNPADRLKISNVYHKAFVEVDEAGTEAAAATAVVMQTRGVAAPPERFEADHPFLFVIRDLRNGTILFLGRVTDPRAD